MGNIIFALTLVLWGGILWSGFWLQCVHIKVAVGSARPWVYLQLAVGLVGSGFIGHFLYPLSPESLSPTETGFAHLVPFLKVFGGVEWGVIVVLLVILLEAKLYPGKFENKIPA